MEAVQKHNTTLQALWLLPRDDWEGSEEDHQRDRLNDLLRENREFRTLTQLAALRLLRPSRIIFHSRSNAPTSSSSSSSDAPHPSPSLATLPTELLLEILGHLAERPWQQGQALSDRQVRKVLSYAEDRGTASVDGAAKSRRLLLEKVDCWRYQSSSEERAYGSDLASLL